MATLEDRRQTAEDGKPPLGLPAVVCLLSSRITTPRLNPMSDIATPGPIDPNSGQPDHQAEVAEVKSWLRQNAVSLAITAGVIGLVIWKLDPIDTLKVVLGLGFIVFIHELGHFLAAKWCDVHVKTFSIGFGPAVPFCSYRYGETTYMLGIVPLGGYVSMVGEGTGESTPDGDPDDDDNDPRSFKNKPVGQRMIIISAGVVMNFILGMACFVAAYLHGVAEKPATAGSVETGGAAWRAGIRTGSDVLKIGGRAMVLEFSHVDVAGLDRLYDLFSFEVIPRLGKLAAGASEPYQYLVESIRKFPDQEEFATLTGLINQSRDLRLLTALAKLHILNRDLPCFVASTQVIATLIDAQWERIFPELLDGDAILRIVSLQTLDDMPDAVMTGVETRTSSPLRLLRNPDLQSPNTRGVYPAGEGAGYAGGILSAGVDGIRVAEALAADFMARSGSVAPDV